MIDPHLWWYVTRASAIIAWVLATLSVLWGVLMSTRVLRSAANAAWLQDLHRYFAGAGLAMVGVHLVSLMLDGWLAMTPAELLVPFVTDYRPFAVAFGILAFYLLLAIQVTSWLMRRLPRRVWHGVHLSSYLVLLLVAVHAGLSGTDVGTPWYLLVSTIVIVVGALSALVPVIMRSGRTVQTSGAPDGSTAHPTAPATRHDPAPSVSLARAGHGTEPLESRAMVVARLTAEAQDVLGLRLVPADGGVLPPWRPGAHVTVRLPNGLQRQYSLCGDPAERDHYDIAVLRTPDSAGGSRWLHENAAPGLPLIVDGPLHHFELIAATEYLFIAGGIGITPILSMIESLPERRPWRLLYLARSRESAAFVDRLLDRHPTRVTFVDTSLRDPGPALDALLDSTNATVYCCGPASLVARVESRVPSARLHVERFRPVERRSVTGDHETIVALARSRRTIVVPAGASLLETLEGDGVTMSASCRTGVCGSCEVRVLEGRPEHLDSVLSDEEKDELSVMYPCVSRSESPRLVLDL